MARRPDLPCADCGQLMWSSTTSLPEGQARCRPCRRANPTALRAKYGQPCVDCGVLAHGARCRPCHFRAVNNDVACPTCSRTFKPHRRKGDIQVFCSKTCISRATPPPPVSQIRCRVWFPNCDQCGRVFAAKSHHTKRCSAQCRIDASGMRIKDLYNACIALRGQGAARWWRRDLVEYLRNRDGDRCGICRRAMDFTLSSGPSGDDMGVTIDHVVPRSQGGDDGPANLRLAHWVCNRQRKAKGGNEQLMLVG